MWLELAGSGAVWLAHAAWYVRRDRRGSLMSLRAVDNRWVVTLLPWAALLFALLALSAWTSAYGGTLGVCCALAGLTAAGSVNAIATPLSPRTFFVASALAGLALVFGVAGWASGA